jgi:hypothetical protein
VNFFRRVPVASARGWTEPHFPAMLRGPRGAGSRDPPGTSMQIRSRGLYPHAHWYFVGLLLLALVGFSHSFLMRLRENDWVHHFHGMVATAWMLLLIGQGWLMSSGRLATHRKVGQLSLLLAPLFVLSGFMIVHAMVAGTGGFARQFGARLAFVVLTSTIYFAVAYVLALHYRRKTALHARWMVTTAILLVPPALARLGGAFPFITSFEMSFHMSFFVIEAIVLLLLLDDARRDRVRAPYLVFLAVVVLQHLAFVLTPRIAAWQQFATWYGGLG